MTNKDFVEKLELIEKDIHEVIGFIDITTVGKIYNVKSYIKRLTWILEELENDLFSNL